MDLKEKVSKLSASHLLVKVTIYRLICAINNYKFIIHQIYYLGKWWVV